jgi:UDP-N-acetyl-2-amino-2-deoxyglucuronate dehydrogenase
MPVDRKVPQVEPPNTRRLRVSVVGGGLISDTHARAVQQVPGAELVAFVGGAGSKARAEQFGLAHRHTLGEAAEKDAIDIAVICTPTGTHADFGMQAAALGMHVLVEKPIDLSVDAARRLDEACRTAGVRLGVVSQRRFDPGFRDLRDLVGSGRLGRLTLGSAALKCWREDGYYAASWHGTGDLGGGGALINQGIHTVDMLCHIMGPAKRVTALTRTLAHSIEVEDVALTVVEFDNDAVGTIEATTAFYSAVSGPAVANAVERLEISGTLGSAILSAGRLIHCSVATGGLPIADAGPAATSALPLEPFRLQHQDFVEAIRTDREPLVTGRDGLRALELVSAIYESARLHKPVDIDAGGG